MRYILNSAVITAPGTYEYRLINQATLIAWLDAGEYQSTIGYKETAQALYQISDHNVAVNRTQITMKPNDEALVFRLTKRLSAEEIKGGQGINFVLNNCEIGILKRLNINGERASLPVFRDREGMALIPAGEFLMGSSDFNNTRPVHTVYLDDFYIDRHQVTNSQYRQFIETTGHREPNYWNDEKFNQPNQPVVGVTWYDAMAYANWTAKRLPTEAEWEKAARGGLVGKKYPWGDEEPDEKMANYDENVGKTTPIGQYPANGYGLYDMAGNVWEWCLDEYKKDFYQNSPRENPLAGESLSDLLANYKEIEEHRVFRGGSWYNNLFYLRVACRFWILPGYRNTLCGFRCASR